MKRLAALILLSVLLVGCVQSIEEVKSDEYIGKTVRVSGEVQEVVSIGPLSGYLLVDEDQSIVVASQDLPNEKDTVRVKGTLKEGIFGIGYYIDADDE